MRTHVVRFAALLVLATCSFLHADAPATQPAKASDFMRFIDKGTTGSRMETADVAYRNADGVTVHLVAAVHVGEKSYFEALNENFKLRDAVLYEMVKPKDAGVPQPGVRTGSTIGDMQRMLKDVLGLEYQLDIVDYSAPNFVHADLDAETFEKMQAERGESFATLMLQQLMKSLTSPPDANATTQPDPQEQLEDLVKMFTRPDGERQFKLRLARQLADFEHSGMDFDGLGGTVLLTERNKAAISVLEKTLKGGKRDVAIFYGAAHMPDLSQRLTQMGFKPIATEWKLAWDLTIRADEPSAIEKALMELMKGLDEPEPARK